MFGNEEDWSEEEKSRMIGDGDAFGKGNTNEEFIENNPEVDNSKNEILYDNEVPESENDGAEEAADQTSNDNGDADTNDNDDDEEVVDMD